MNNTTLIAVIAVVVIIGGGSYWWATHTAESSIPGVIYEPGNLLLGTDGNQELGIYLIGSNGMTLYTYDKDEEGVSHCAGDCAKNWPPYLITDLSGLNNIQAGISGDLGTIARADHSTQVMFNGHPLYFYIGDKNAGDAKGNDVNGVWHIVSTTATPVDIGGGIVEGGGIACSADAKLCPDGSYVGRTGPNCEFVCPGVSGIGISGRVTLGPMCPVMQDPPDPQCADRDYAATITVYRASDTAHAVATTLSGEGYYEVALPAGTYLVHASGGSVMPRCSDVTVTVTTGYASAPNIFCDTGIR